MWSKAKHDFSHVSQVEEMKQTKNQYKLVYLYKSFSWIIYSTITSSTDLVSYKLPSLKVQKLLQPQVSPRFSRKQPELVFLENKGSLMCFSCNIR